MSRVEWLGMSTAKIHSGSNICQHSAMFYSNQAWSSNELQLPEYEEISLRITYV